MDDDDDDDDDDGDDGDDGDDDDDNFTRRKRALGLLQSTSGDELLLLLLHTAGEHLSS